ncbi:hypothetical protein DICSQDRAFT_178558 [Dichomitus squalens LYAD-421 SS1]|uniref:uncharacterized protein n=1 Tax=Dichomitus squalens (strain LYAD-421) TaxID=732165 RepID=UPI0004413ECC|nr:uncharacterized protein DICSQDRAFT_178558 [Dichomitus squalens LYAD-421 SS1]EJF64032.1 hypothetical protein DICSQDRAFT_178558 [Dichomitus squalens LYAD-421 SS1]
MAPISKLPPEVLSEIFAVVAKVYQTTRNPPRFRPRRTYKWIIVTHVCRSWRHVALETPRLWSRIVLSDPEATQEVLARSKKAPLWVTGHVTCRDEPRRKLLDAVMKESSRMKELDLTGPVPIFQSVAALSKGGAELLEILSLSGSGRCVPDITIHPLYHTLPVFFGGHTPNLRLHVHMISVKWDNPVLCATLTNLTLVAKHDLTSRLGTFAQLDSSMLPASQRTVLLPNLRKLTLSSYVLDCANFLNHVSFPADTRLVVTGRTEVGIEELVRVLSEHLSRALPLLTARISPVYTSQMRISGWRTLLAGPPADKSAAPAADVDLYLEAYPHPCVYHALVRRATFFGAVRRLELQSLMAMWGWQDLFATLFARVEDLRVLAISGQPQLGLLEALSEVRREAGDGARGSVLSAKLHTVQRVKFGLSYSELEWEYLEQVLGWLMLRCNEGVPIEMLELRECTDIVAEDVNRLREVVAEVDWDGIEIHVIKENEDEDVNFLDVPDDDDDDDDDDDEVDWTPFGY